MADEPVTCRGTRRDGQPCQQTEMLNDEGLCPAHREGARERLREAGRRGGEATAQRHRDEEDTLDPEQLGDLDSYADAKRWLATVARGVLTGIIDRSRADPATRALKQWISAHTSELADEKLEELERRIEAIENGGGSPGDWGPGAGR